MTSKKPIEESVSQVASSEQLPEYWPATPPPDPVRAVWIPWPIAVVLAPLLWLMPGRMGPHFAAVRWPGAIAAHLLWTVYGLACIVNAYESNDHCWVAYLQGQVPGQQQHPVWPAPTMSQIIRTPLAVTAWQLAEEIDDTADKFVACLGTLALVGSSLVVLAALIERRDRGRVDPLQVSHAVSHALLPGRKPRPAVPLPKSQVCGREVRGTIEWAFCPVKRRGAGDAGRIGSDGALLEHGQEGGVFRLQG